MENDKSYLEMAKNAIRRADMIRSSSHDDIDRAIMFAAVAQAEAAEAQTKVLERIAVALERLVGCTRNGLLNIRHLDGMSVEYHSE